VKPNPFPQRSYILTWKKDDLIAKLVKSMVPGTDSNINNNSATQNMFQKSVERG
jgi:hypothetical protein